MITARAYQADDLSWLGSDMVKEGEIIINLLKFSEDLPDEEIFDQLFKNESIMIERIISAGQCSPPGFWYEQEHNEWVLVLQGDAVISYRDGQITELQTGDYLFLPADLAHRVEKTSQDPPCIWLAIHFE
ncbi:MAG TPA: cupin domain-containing protein [Syntrophomonadaceae bacterium]|nr:cupin domain-containing protein [Syntrophomonadaceae bacterium]HNX92128.1 cupin domain-containing protein [Syntrophomonas sp.]